MSACSPPSIRPSTADFEREPNDHFERRYPERPMERSSIERQLKADLRAAPEFAPLRA